MQPVLTAVRRLGIDNRTDRVLLASVAATRDAAALTELVRRYAALVHRVAADLFAPSADDVAQAVFVLLGERSIVVARRESAAGWLYEAARRLALKARTAAARRARHEGRVTPRRP